MLIVDSITFNARDIHIKNNLTTNNSSVSWTLEIIIYDNWNVNSCRRKSCFFLFRYHRNVYYISSKLRKRFKDSTRIRCNASAIILTSNLSTFSVFTHLQIIFLIVCSILKYLVIILVGISIRYLTRNRLFIIIGISSLALHE